MRKKTLLLAIGGAAVTAAIVGTSIAVTSGGSSAAGPAAKCGTDGTYVVLTFNSGDQTISVSDPVVAFYKSNGTEIGSRTVVEFRPITLTPGQTWSNSESPQMYPDNVYGAPKCSVATW